MPGFGRRLLRAELTVEEPAKTQSPRRSYRLLAGYAIRLNERGWGIATGGRLRWLVSAYQNSLSRSGGCLLLRVLCDVFSLVVTCFHKRWLVVRPFCLHKIKAGLGKPFTERPDVFAVVHLAGSGVAAP